MKKCYFLFLICTITLKLSVFANQSCLILLDQRDTENVGRMSSFYLISKLQSAIAEQTVPLLVHASLWNSFIERRAAFEQKAEQIGTKENEVFKLYQEIKNRILHWTNYYNEISNDIIQNKFLVAQRINEEFYDVDIDITDVDYQILVNHLTHFDPKDWAIYKKSGFYLLIPKQYSANHSLCGFKIDSLEEVAFSQDIVHNYFESQRQHSLAEGLSDFFLTRTDLSNQDTPYKWDIVLSGHGGSIYTEKNDDEKIIWNGEPLISDLTLQEFKNILDFFQTQLNTHTFHYSSCYAGGYHIGLIFDKQTYNFAIICECLTDCATYCKWTNTLPSKRKKFLNADDLYYDSVAKSWNLNMKSPYNWDKFFDSISAIDFSLETIDFLPKALVHITHPVIANISLLRRPGINQFYPVSPSGTIKFDDQFVSMRNKNKIDEDIIVHGAKLLLIESSYIDYNIKLDNTESTRIISIKPGKACHYIKKLNFENPIDLPSVFWQAEFQRYDKIFLIDECVFSNSPSSLVFKNALKTGKDAIINNVLVIQQSNYSGRFIRLFFTIHDQAMMIVAKKTDPLELDENIAIQEIVTLSPEARDEYGQHYLALKESVNNLK
jgi:hypothetical protein